MRHCLKVQGSLFSSFTPDRTPSLRPRGGTFFTALPVFKILFCSAGPDAEVVQETLESLLPSSSPAPPSPSSLSEIEFVF